MTYVCWLYTLALIFVSSHSKSPNYIGKNLKNNNILSSHCNIFFSSGFGRRSRCYIWKESSNTEARVKSLCRIHWPTPKPWTWHKNQHSGTIMEHIWIDERTSVVKSSSTAQAADSTLPRLQPLIHQVRCMILYVPIYGEVNAPELIPTKVLLNTLFLSDSNNKLISCWWNRLL